jgi:hypothetical protein
MKIGGGGMILRGIDPTLSQLGTDWKALIGELQSLAAKSGLTVADIESLALDGQSISQAGYYFRGSELHTVVSELATAVAGGTSTSQAQSDWTALFANSSVSTTVINNTFNDLVKAIQDSQVTTTDLTTVANDEAAIQKDLANLFCCFWPVAGGETGSTALVGTDPLPSMAVTLPNLPASSQSASQAIVNSLPAVSEPVIVSPGLPFILPWGVNLLGSLTHVGVVTGPVVTPEPIPIPMPIRPIPMPNPGPIPIPIPIPLPMASASANWSASQSSGIQQLLADEKALQTELQSLAAKSGVTVAELQSLAQDSRAISQARVAIDRSALSKVIAELAAAVAGGTSLSQAQSDWAALFNGSSVSTTLITNTFNDLVSTIGSSKVTTTDLMTVANDQAAIQTDLKNLWNNTGGGTGAGSGSKSGGNSGGTHVKSGHRVTKHPPTPVVVRKTPIHSGHVKALNTLRKRG